MWTASCFLDAWCPPLERICTEARNRRTNGFKSASDVFASVRLEGSMKIFNVSTIRSNYVSFCVKVTNCSITFIPFSLHFRCLCVLLEVHLGKRDERQTPMTFDMSTPEMASWRPDFHCNSSFHRLCWTVEYGSHDVPPPKVPKRPSAP